MLKLGLWRSLFCSAAADGQQPRLLVAGGQRQGRAAWHDDPAFDWGFVKLAAATPVDGGLLMVIAFENLSGGMGTAAFVAFLMSLCNQRFTATQFALLSAFASVGRVWVGAAGRCAGRIDRLAERSSSCRPGRRAGVVDALVAARAVRALEVDPKAARGVDD